MMHTCRTKGRRQLSVLPLPRCSEPSRPCSVLVIGVGDLGRGLISGIERHDGECVPVTDDSAAEQWHEALRQIRQHGGVHGSAAGSDAGDAVLVGSKDDVLASWVGLDEKLAGSWEQARLRKIVLQIDGQPPPSVLPTDCRGWFHWAQSYSLGDLTQEQATELAARMLRSGLAPTLADVAVKEAFPSPVSVGAACGWVPEMTVGEAIAGCLVAGLATTLACPPAPRTRNVPCLVGTDLTLGLRQRLAAHFRRCSSVLVHRLRKEARRGPLPDLEGDVVMGMTAAQEMVQAWTRSQWDAIASRLVALGENPDRLSAVHSTIDDAVRQIEAWENELGNQITAISSQRQRLARMTAAAHQRQLTAGQRSTFSRRPRIWWETRRVDRLLGQFTSAYSNELTLRSLTQGLHELRRTLAAIHDRLLQLVQTAAMSPAGAQDIGEPGHPCLVAMYDANSIRTTIALLANSLLLRPGRTPEQELWRSLTASVLAGHSTHESWSQMTRTASNLACDSDTASQPLAVVCRGIVPRFRGAEFERLLTQVAEPRPRGPAGKPWFERVVFLDEQGSRQTPPCIIYLRWQA